MTIRIIKHEAVPQTGSFEVLFSYDGPASTCTGTMFRGRRLNPEPMDSNRALEKPPRPSREASGTTSETINTMAIIAIIQFNSVTNPNQRILVKSTSKTNQLSG